MSEKMDNLNKKYQELKQELGFDSIRLFGGDIKTEAGLEDVIAFLEAEKNGTGELMLSFASRPKLA